MLKYTLPSAHIKYAAPWTYLSGGRCSHQLTANQNRQALLKLSNLQLFIIIIVPDCYSLLNLSPEMFFCGNQKFFSGVGFTESTTMLKIYIWHFVLFLFSDDLHTHTGFPVYSEKSISLYSPIRNQYRFNRTSGVRTFQISSETIYS